MECVYCDEIECVCDEVEQQDEIEAYKRRRDLEEFGD